MQGRNPFAVLAMTAALLGGASPAVAEFRTEAASARPAGPGDPIEQLIVKFNQGKGGPAARAMMVRAIAEAYVDPYTPGSTAHDHTASNAKILAFLKIETTNPAIDVAREATLAYSRRAPAAAAAAAVQVAYENGKLETEHYFRETLIQLHGLQGTKQQDDAIDSLIVANSLRSKEAPPMALSRLFAAYLSSAPFTATIHPANKEKIDAFLIGQEPRFAGQAFDEMAAIEYGHWLEARAHLRGLTETEIPDFMIKQLLSSAGSADKITAALLAHFGGRISEAATKAQREALLAALTVARSSSAPTRQASTDYRGMAIQRLQPVNQCHSTSPPPSAL